MSRTCRYGRRRTGCASAPHFSGDWWSTSTDVTTEWRFRSARAGAEEPVSLPLLQVDYGVPAALDGSVDRTAKLTLSADHQPGVEGADVTGLRLWASSDDGENWQEVTETVIRAYRLGPAS